MKIIDLEPGDPRLETELLPVLRELRPHLTPELFRDIYATGHAQGLRFSAAYADDGADGGVCVGAAGWRIVINTSSVKKLYVDDLVTSENARSGGVGHAMLAHLEGHARAAGCYELNLDSGTHRTAAHRFYLRERLDIVAFNFARELKPLP